MLEGLVEKEGRVVRVQTVHGAIEGELSISPSIRTLDELNLATQKFLRIDAPAVTLPGCSFDDGLLGINKDSVLFVVETSHCHPTTDQRVERSHFVRTPIRLRVGEFDIQGFLHIRGLRDPLTWLSQSRQPFLALTAASVVGPDVDLATSFIAVSPRHVLAAQGLAPEEAVAAVGQEAAGIEAR